ncbi:hexosaminidase [Kibdelosporangium banguiense]|uniref:beta-N-acetylhexosaminidase n=1 Tax=Kibdelosporangium banguiense TaxID=1365924 RepID=A0ABS4TTY9_9PSEU|nr:family 20 glycosylhydrolase [Kibdelosporangium banguiense]MBP2327416.1 hexosaminidase [Kibdelosporangium banguiense]
MTFSVVPVPAEIRPVPQESFQITAATRVRALGAASPVGAYLSEILAIPSGADGEISLEIGETGVGDAGYRLDVSRAGVVLTANTGTGLFAGVQTLRQITDGQGLVQGCEILDYPRFRHRGAMLDVARHFYSPAEVKRYIDQLAQYKINVLHLHLTDDQGWRLDIESWPKLATIGGATQIGGGPGGCYTQAEYRDIVAHATSRHITVIPEIDIPGHVNAALVAYPELSCDGVAPLPFTTTGTATGFSSLSTDKEITYRFVEDVLTEVAALTPGEYLHIGTDETHATPGEGAQNFIRRVLPMVTGLGKKAMGWHEILKATPDAVAQFWSKKAPDPLVTEAALNGTKILLSPANKVYLDMKYTPDSPIGFKWAGYIELRDAYDWDPGTYLDAVPEDAILGVEAPLWSEHLRSRDDLDFMAFPRIAAVAELGWSPRSAHGWENFATRLAQHGPRWEAEGIAFYRSPQIPWA